MILPAIKVHSTYCVGGVIRVIESTPSLLAVIKLLTRDDAILTIGKIIHFQQIPDFHVTESHFI